MREERFLIVLSLLGLSFVNNQITGKDGLHMDTQKEIIENTRLMKVDSLFLSCRISYGTVIGLHKVISHHEQKKIAQD